MKLLWGDVVRVEKYRNDLKLWVIEETNLVILCD
jgi:hypothetical protein